MSSSTQWTGEQEGQPERSIRTASRVTGSVRVSLRATPGPDRVAAPRPDTLTRTGEPELGLGAAIGCRCRSDCIALQLTTTAKLVDGGLFLSRFASLTALLSFT